MTEIKAGTVVDLAIAKAIGMTTAVEFKGDILISSRERDELRGIEHPTCEGSVACIPFSPSKDLNAAFAAAKKVGLFEIRCLAQNSSEQWRIWNYDPTELVAPAETPALAICAAILKLKE